MALTTLEKIKLQREYKDKRASVEGAAPLAKIKLLREVKEILAKLKGDVIQEPFEKYVPPVIDTSLPSFHQFQDAFGITVKQAVEHNFITPEYHINRYGKDVLDGYISPNGVSRTSATEAMLDVLDAAAKSHIGISKSVVDSSGLKMPKSFHLDGDRYVVKTQEAADSFNRMKQKLADDAASGKYFFAASEGDNVTYFDPLEKKRVTISKRKFQQGVWDLEDKFNREVKYVSMSDLPNEEPQPAPSIQDVNAILPMLRHFIGKSQLSAMGDGVRGEEKDFFKGKFVDLAKTIENMPSTRQTDGQGDKAVAYLHYFSPNSDWYISEKDIGAPDDEVKGAQHQAFGYAILNGDTQNAEMGYISIEELINAGVELDLYWTPKTLGEVKGKEEQKPNPDFTDNSMQEMVDAVVSNGGEVTGKQAPDVFFIFYGGVSAKLTAVASDQAGSTTGFTGKNIDTGEESSLMQSADQAMTWLMTNAKENDEKQYQENPKLTDLLSGKYNDKQPEVFLQVVKEVVAEINDVEALKPALYAYLEANKDKVSAVMESALKEVFGKLWNAGV